MPAPAGARDWSTSRAGLPAARVARRKETARERSTHPRPSVACPRQPPGPRVDVSALEKALARTGAKPESPIRKTAARMRQDYATHGERRRAKAARKIEAFLDEVPPSFIDTMVGGEAAIAQVPDPAARRAIAAETLRMKGGRPRGARRVARGAPA